MPAALLGPCALVALAAVPHSTVEDHVHGIAAEYMSEIRISCGFRARDDDEQTGQQLPLRDYGLLIHTLKHFRPPDDPGA
jgi:hypothetical protein